MDPSTGKLYESIEHARRAGVKHPVELYGRPRDVQRISDAVKRDNRRKVKAKRKANRSRRSS